MMSLDQAIAQYEQFANVCEHHGLTASREEFEQLAAWLRELVERRKYELTQGCYGCKHKPFEEKHRCRSCKRMCLDKYEPERRNDEMQ